MLVLAIDTSFEACSAAIVDGDDVLWREQRLIGRGHSEALPVMVADGLDAASVEIADLDRVAIVIGPGAFAGVRVGLAFARGLCLGTKAKAVGVTSLKALAACAGARGATAPVFDARRGQVYAALYDGTLRERIEPFVATPQEAAARLAAAEAEGLTLAGSGAALVAPHLSAAAAISPVLHIDPVVLARLAAAAPAPSLPPAPLYLRPPDAAPSAGSIFDTVLAE